MVLVNAICGAGRDVPFLSDYAKRISGLAQKRNHAVGRPNHQYNVADWLALRRFALSYTTSRLIAKKEEPTLQPQAVLQGGIRHYPSMIVVFYGHLASVSISAST
jgi:hypothetical protein